MKENTEKKLGWNYFWLAMTAFGGLGLECLYAFLLEPMLYGASMQEWTTVQMILHWIITCVTWGLAHIFTKGSLAVGLSGVGFGFLFGVAYLVVGRDVKKTWLVQFVMFAF